MEKRLSTTLTRALRLLVSFEGEQSVMSLTDLAGKIDSKPGSVYSLVSTLEKFGLLERDPETKQYELGSRILVLANKVLARLDLRTIAAPILSVLAAKFSANVHLAILFEHEVLYLDRKEGSPSVVLTSIVGDRVPIHCTGLGKALLAFNREEQQRFLTFAELPSLTPKTITDPIALSLQLQEVRKRGYAVDQEEFHPGNVCFASPIRDFTGAVIAAISISFAENRSEVSAPSLVISDLQDCAASISASLGYATPA